MSTVKPEMINRAKVCEALRSGKHRQIRNMIGNWSNKDAAVCFQGVVLRVLGHFICIERALGLCDSDLVKLIQSNDYGKSFYKLADDLENMPYKIYR